MKYSQTVTWQNGGTRARSINTIKILVGIITTITILIVKIFIIFIVIRDDNFCDSRLAWPAPAGGRMPYVFVRENYFKW